MHLPPPEASPDSLAFLPPHSKGLKSHLARRPAMGDSLYNRLLGGATNVGCLLLDPETVVFLPTSCVLLPSSWLPVTALA